MTATACTANASFSSKRSTSCRFQPAFFATLRDASTGVISSSFGSRPLVAWATMRAIGVSPSAEARAADITTSAAAPSLTGGALPAVTLPSFLNAGFRARSTSAVVSARTDSSWAKSTGSPFFCLIGTGSSSAANFPAAWAAAAFLWLSAA